MMLHYPTINPIAFHVGPLPVHWYGLMYLFGFFACWLLMRWRVKQGLADFTATQVADIVFYGALGAIVGGRFGYMLFYDFPQFIDQPWVIFKLWDGGMSFHGGLLGVLIVLLLYARAIKKSFFEVTDFLVPMVPIGLGLGRLGNFINGELWGRVTDMPWGMVYPRAGELPRHPSQLYECLCEGLLLFVILWWFSSKPRPRMAVSGLFLICYGLFRFFLEFFRQPDPQLGFIFGHWMTMGQLLSLPMMLFGGIFLFLAYTVEKGS